MNYDALEWYVERHGEEFRHEYEKLLLGKTVDKFLGTEVYYHVKAYIVLSDGEEYETHYRWASEEEDMESKELDDRYVPMQEYYEKAILGKKIVKIDIGAYERDDEVYVYAYVDEDNFLEIPLNIDIDAIYEEQDESDEVAG